MDNLKLTILDMWKRANLINIPLPLNILVKFKFDNLNDLHNLEKILNEIHVINTYSLEQFDFKTSFFKINYYGDPKNLSDEFSRDNAHPKKALIPHTFGNNEPHLTDHSCSPILLRSAAYNLTNTLPQDFF